MLSCLSCCADDTLRSLSTLNSRDVCKLMVPVGYSGMAMTCMLVYVFTPMTDEEDSRKGSILLIGMSLLSGLGLCLATYGFHRHTASFATIAEDDNNDTKEKEGLFRDGQKSNPDASGSTFHIDNIDTDDSDSFSSNSDNSQSSEKNDKKSKRDKSRLLQSAEVAKNVEKQKMRKLALTVHALLSLLSAIACIILSLLLVRDVAHCGKDPDSHTFCGANIAWSIISLAVSCAWMGVVYLGYMDLRKAILLRGKMETTVEFILQQNGAVVEKKQFRRAQSITGLQKESEFSVISLV